MSAMHSMLTTTRTMMIRTASRGPACINATVGADVVVVVQLEAQRVDEAPEPRRRRNHAGWGIPEFRKKGANFISKFRGLSPKFHETFVKFAQLQEKTSI